MNLPSNRIQSTDSTISHSGTPASAGRSVGGHGSHSPSPSSYPLQEGQIVKGEITDLRNNEITIVLPDGTAINANISDHTNLTIGKSASFKVIEITPKGIALENLSKGRLDAQDLTILKALEEAEIPKNERNISIVRELLNQRMPIHKESIQQMIRHSLSNHDVSIESLVLMKKHHLPMNKVTATQFKQYRNGEHSLIGEIEQLSDSLPRLLGVLAENAPEEDVAAFGNRLVSLLTDTMPEHKMLNLDLSSIPLADREMLAEYLAKVLPSDHPLLEAEGGLTIRDSILNGSIPLNEIGEMLNSVLINEVADEAALHTYNSITPSVEESLNEASTIHSAKDEVNSEAHSSDIPAVGASEQKDAASGITSVDASVKESATPGMASDPLAAGGVTSLSPHLRVTVEHILDQWKGLQQINQEIGFLLPPKDRNELLGSLNPNHVPPEAKERILSGKATLTETIQILQKQLSDKNPTGVKELLSSEPFTAILREAIQTNWMMSPSTLMQKERVDQFYPKLLHELNEVTKLIQQNLGGRDSDLLAGQSKTMQENIDFMKTLNQFFSYIQLPLHMKDKNIHSDLYIYTKKQELKKRPNKLRAFLHLDMENIGGLDVDITLESNTVTTTFFCEDSLGKSILETNIHLLEESLAENGYLFQATVEQSEKGFDMVKDLLEADSPNVGMTRYSFDIRA